MCVPSSKCLPADLSHLLIIFLFVECHNAMDCGLFPSFGILENMPFHFLLESDGKIDANLMSVREAKTRKKVKKKVNLGALKH